MKLGASLCAAVHASVCVGFYIADNGGGGGGDDATAARMVVRLQINNYASTFTHVRANENEWFLICVARNMFEFMLLVLSQKFYNASQ